MASTKREDEIEKMLEDCGRGLECITEFVIDQPKIPSVVLDHLDNLHCLLEKLEELLMDAICKSSIYSLYTPLSLSDFFPINCSIHIVARFGRLCCNQEYRVRFSKRISF